MIWLKRSVANYVADTSSPFYFTQSDYKKYGHVISLYQPARQSSCINLYAFSEYYSYIVPNIIIKTRW